ncbi:uncharacterized protein B0I36DRAFT_31048 [Microdochium trichocladiopsis]|uniref:Secreted protein n=1 Tax=Microdochium trichocladiopsis TaxID=1682393 RepID=A0A9P8XXN9_9PEZI|nr:uncharacterized protein B0I36DRAFT_31048 [Microdochium trichocladiopsis]KAH7021302.1 hypothetical protein B0I36DRAFT_31048 [Microdochium trichocladiopsis]
MLGKSVVAPRRCVCASWLGTCVAACVWMPCSLPSCVVLCLSHCKRGKASRLGLCDCSSGRGGPETEEGVLHARIQDPCCSTANSASFVSIRIRRCRWWEMVPSPSWNHGSHVAAREANEDDAL